MTWSDRYDVLVPWAYLTFPSQELRDLIVRILLELFDYPEAWAEA